MKNIAHAFWSALQMGHRVVCLVRGHDLVMHFDRRVLALRCIVCGYRTKGWTLDERSPRRRETGTVLPLPTARPIRGPRAA